MTKGICNISREDVSGAWLNHLHHIQASSQSYLVTNWWSC